MEIEQPNAARAASMDKARLAGFLKPQDKPKLDSFSLSFALTPDDLALG